MEWLGLLMYAVAVCTSMVQYETLRERRRLRIFQLDHGVVRQLGVHRVPPSDVVRNDFEFFAENFISTLDGRPLTDWQRNEMTVRMEPPPQWVKPGVARQVAANLAWSHRSDLPPLKIDWSKFDEGQR